ncbi:MAG: hypothetical protein Q4P13_07795, partial [Psychrobacter sp.]|nr:hypothetical protein [Psychrobacter sp.]
IRKDSLNTADTQTQSPEAFDFDELIFEDEINDANARIMSNKTMAVKNSPSVDPSLNHQATLDNSTDTHSNAQLESLIIEDDYFSLNETKDSQTIKPDTQALASASAINATPSIVPSPTPNKPMAANPSIVSETKKEVANVGMKDEPLIKSPASHESSKMDSPVKSQPTHSQPSKTLPTQPTQQPASAIAKPLIEKPAAVSAAPTTPSSSKSTADETVKEIADSARISDSPLSDSMKPLAKSSEASGPLALVDSVELQHISDQVNSEMLQLKTHLHLITLQFHELGNISARLMKHLRALQSDSSDDFSITYEQMLEVRSHLVAAKQQAGEMPSLLDLAEEALESEMYVAQLRKKR